MPITIDFRRIDKKEETIYKAVVMAAKRARQIHKKMNDDLKKQLGEVENEEDLDEEVVDREKIVKEFDSMDKPSVMAMKEYLNDKLHIKKDEE